MENSKTVLFKKISLTIFTSLVGLILALPFIYMFLMSLMKNSNSIFVYPPKLFTGFNFINYLRAIQFINLFSRVGNTLIIVLAQVGLGITSSILVAYGFSRYQNKYSNFFFFVLLSTMMIPWVVTMIPAYAEFEFLGWIGSFLPLTIPWIGGSAFNVFLLRQFMMGIPKELDEAAKIDGCSSFRILWQIIVPELLPCIATLFVFSFIGAWNDYLGPSIYLQTDSSKFTISIALQLFFDSNGKADWEMVMAASVLVSLPMILILVFAQKAYINGIVTTGLK
ncbi:MAG: carbohydrate ABC transporter permease [Bacillales bacterium]|jgi:multiple sugar transport system permease protein|nr:carbohydrate ABC transporter permease [Bacillales bacterium]